MKKIISMLTISALAFGTVFADVSLEYTQKGIIAKSTGSDTSSKLDLNGYAADISGDVVFTLSNDVAGASVTVDPNYAEAGRDNMSTEVGPTVNTEFFSEYYGWVNFLDGKMKLQSGIWGSRIVNRMTENAGNWESDEYERYKPGVRGGDAGADISRIAAVNGEKVLSTALTYTNETVSVTGILLSNQFKSETNATTGFTTTTESGFGLAASAQLNEETKLTAILKSAVDQQIAFAAFIDKKNFTVKGRSFDVMAGATVAQGAFNSSTYSDSEALEAGFDLRFTYKLSEKATLTSMNNLSYLGWRSSFGSADQKYFLLWDMVSLAVNVSEKVQVTATVEWDYADLFASDNGSLSFIPGVTYIVGPGAELSSGVIIDSSNWPNPTTADISIPFILHVAL